MDMRRIALAVSVAVALWAWTNPAEACLNGVIMEHDEAVKKVARAQKAMDKGKYRKVLRLLRADHYDFVGAHLLRRIRTLQAVARLRTGRTKSAERTLRNLLKKDKDNPFLRTRLAEAMAGRKGMDAIEAWKILNKLEKEDLIPDAHGYATLAVLRHRANDSKGRDRAITRCRAMAKDKSICPLS
jgi:predicted Zn-dependent protease